MVILVLNLKTPVDDKELAKAQVLQLKEVQEFKKDVENNGRSQFWINIEEQKTKDSRLLIRVYETFPDHITTFNWYGFDPKTKKVEIMKSEDF